MKVVEKSNKAVPVLAIGTPVETKYGLGEVVDIILQAANYGNGWELDPPAIVVLLENGSVVTTCLCSLKLPHSEKATSLLHQEYERLWPPLVIDEAGEVIDTDDPIAYKKGK